MTFEELLAKSNSTQRRTKKSHQEEKIQMACVKWFRLQFPGKLLVHCPNGGARNKNEAAIFKAAGVVAGFPDLFLYEAHGGYHGLAIEMKTEIGRQSRPQIGIQQLLEAAGYKYMVIRSLESFIDSVCDYLTDKYTKD